MYTVTLDVYALIDTFNSRLYSESEMLSITINLLYTCVGKH